MSIWVVLWLFLSGALIYFTGWTVLILQKQKRAWQSYAKKYKLRYTPSSFLDSPTVSGVIDGYTVSIFVGEHQSEDARRARKLSAIEIGLHTTMAADGAIASADMVPVVQDLGFKTEIKLDHADWPENAIASTENKSMLESYLTDERRDALTKLMKIDNGAVILIFRGDVFLLRFDTPDPFDTPQKLDRIVKQMVSAIEVLEADEVLKKAEEE